MKPKTTCRRSSRLLLRSCTEWRLLVPVDVMVEDAELATCGYSAPGWLLNGHLGASALGGNLQTIWAAKLARRYRGSIPAYKRERWDTADGDFIDIDFHGDSAATDHRPWLVLFHGLEGSSRSHYALAFASWARSQGWAYAVPHFRGCSGEINRTPRAYHSGDHEEIAWILERLRARTERPLVVIGVSLGGNALLRWAEETGDYAARIARAVCTLSSPIDLAASGRAIGRGFNRQVYNRMFLRTMRQKALCKLEQFPGLFSRDKLLAARDLYDFDNLFTAPLHGFRDTDDYWARASAKPQLHRIRIPALLINASNDPIVPVASVPAQHEVASHVTICKPKHGGHAGFAAGHIPGHLFALPEIVMRWVDEHA